MPGSLVVPGSVLESAMLAWLGCDVMGPSTVDMSTHTLGGHFGSSGVPSHSVTHLGLGLLFP